MRTRLITRESDLHALAGDWDRLWACSPRREAFGCFAWARQFLKAYGCGRGIHCGIVEAASGHICGMFPVYHDDGGWLRFIGDPRSDYSDVLCEPEQALEVVPAALDAILHSRRLRLRAVPEHALLLRGLSAARPNGYQVVMEECCPAIVFDERGQTAAQLVKKDSLRRHEKKVAKMGAIRLSRITTQAQALAALPTLFDQHVRRWRIAGMPSFYEQEQNCEFFRGLVRDDAFWPLVDFRLLYAGDRIVATHFGFNFDRRFIWYRPTFDPELAQLGAGEVLLKHLITETTKEGVREFDFTRGNEGFKQRFANVTRVNYTVTRPGVWERLRTHARTKLVHLVKGGWRPNGSNGNGNAHRNGAVEVETATSTDG